MKKNNLLNMVYVYIVFLICIEPTKIMFSDTVSKVFICMKIALIVFLLLQKIVKNRISNTYIYIFTFILISIISNVINNHSLSFIISRYINWIVITLFVDNMIQKDYKAFFKYASQIFTILIILNLISTIIQPVDYFDITTRVHFLGYDNDNVPIILIGIFIILFNSYIQHNKLNLVNILIIAMAIISLALVWSANGIIAITLFLLYFVFFYKKQNKFTKIFNYRNFVIISIIIFLTFIVFRMQDNFKYIIEDVLHRDMTFTGRTEIWDYALKSIKQHWIIGIGIYDYKVRLLETGVYHAHCTYLNVIFETGIIGLISYISILFKAGKKIMKDRNNELKFMVAYFFLIYFIITIMEVYINNLMFFVLVAIASNMDLIIDKERGKIDEKSGNINVS